MDSRTRDQIQAEHNATQAELARMAKNEQLEPAVRAAICFAAAAILASPKFYALDLSDLGLRAR